jgi:hypothetical protein
MARGWDLLAVLVRENSDMEHVNELLQLLQLLQHRGSTCSS